MELKDTKANCNGSADYTIHEEETRFICRQGNLNDCEKGVGYVDFTGGVELFEVRLNDDGSNPECIKNLGKVCLALTMPAILFVLHFATLWFKKISLPKFLKIVKCLTISVSKLHTGIF